MNFVLNIKKIVANKSMVDSREVNRMIIFLLSHKKGRNKQEKITPGLFNNIPLSEASTLPNSKPALLLSSIF